MFWWTKPDLKRRKKRKLYFIPTGIILRSWEGIAAPITADPETLGWFGFLWKNLLPVTIGNIIGGAVFVGISYWGAYLKPSPEVSKKVD